MGIHSTHQPPGGRKLQEIALMAHLSASIVCHSFFFQLECNCIFSFFSRTQCSFVTRPFAQVPFLVVGEDWLHSSDTRFDSDGRHFCCDYIFAKCLMRWWRHILTRRDKNHFPPSPLQPKLVDQFVHMKCHFVPQLNTIRTIEAISEFPFLAWEIHS